MSFPVKAYHNGDDVFLLWRPAAAIKDCRGFAIEFAERGHHVLTQIPEGFKIARKTHALGDALDAVAAVHLQQ